MILAAAVLANHSLSTHTSLNTTPSVHSQNIVLGNNLTDDAIKYSYMCIWPLVWHVIISISAIQFINTGPLQWSLIFYSPIKEKEKQWRIKGLTMGQWINLNRSNISVFARQYSVLWEKTCPILPPLVGLTPGR